MPLRGQREGVQTPCGLRLGFLYVDRDARFCEVTISSIGRTVVGDTGRMAERTRPVHKRVGKAEGDFEGGQEEVSGARLKRAPDVVTSAV